MATSPVASSFWRDAVLVFLLALALLLPGSWLLPLVDRDEPKFSQATAEMMERGSWTVPTFNGEYRFDKPPLTYWWMAAHMAILGKTELATRLHTILSAALVAVLLYEFGLVLFSRWAGLWAAGGWMTSLQVALHGRLAVADMPMILAVVVIARCLYALLFTETKTGRWKWQVLLAFALAFGFLAKGPIAWLVPLLGLILTRLMLWRSLPQPWSRLGWWWVVPSSLGLIAIWGIPALMETQGKFAESGLGEHVVERGFRSFNDRLFVPFYYPLTMFLSLYPWSPLLFPGISLVRERWSAKQAFLVGWFVAPFLIFMFYATQLPHYVMPGFPAFFLLLFQAGKAPVCSKWWHHVGFRLVHGIVMVVLLTAVGVLAFVGSPNPTLTLGLVFLLAGVGALGAMSLAAVKGFRFGGAIFTIFYIFCWLASSHYLAKVHPVPPLAQRIAQQAGEVELVGMGYAEPSLVFYTDRKIPNWRFDGRPRALEFFSEEEGPGFVAIKQREVRLDDLWKQRPPEESAQFSDDEIAKWIEARGLTKVGTFEGMNPGRVSYVWLDLYERPTKAEFEAAKAKQATELPKPEPEVVPMDPTITP